jgi:hypothetical protein
MAWDAGGPQRTSGRPEPGFAERPTPMYQLHARSS